MTEETKPSKAIIYTDGGFERDYKVGGWGIHGYRYNEEPPKKGTGNPKAIPTKDGYVGNKDGAELVTLTHYISGVGYVPNAKSCNQTELHAVKTALEYIQENGIKHCTIFTDSKVTVQGLNKFVNTWRVNGWKNRDGDDLECVDLWKKTDELFTLLKQNEYFIDLLHIDGHSGHFGNEQADDWARKGNALGIRKVDYSFITEADGQGFWKTTHTPSKLLGTGRWYFSTNDLDYLSPEGHGIYYMGNNDGDDELTGKPMAENGQTILFLKEPDPVLEMIRADAIEKDSKRVGRLIIGRLDAICSGKIYDELHKYGVNFLKPKRSCLDLTHSKKRPILVEKTPIGLGFNAIANLNHLEDYLNAFLKKEPFLIVTEITDLLYDKEVKKDKVVLKLSDKVGPVTKFIDIDFGYCLKPGSAVTGPDDPDIRSINARLIINRDLPRRSTLTDIADKNPRVFVVSWRVSDQVIRFASIVECEDGYGIWSATDSNMLYIKSTQ